MRRARVIVGSESGRGASVLMSRTPNATSEREKMSKITSTKDETLLTDKDFDAELPVVKQKEIRSHEFSPVPINQVDKNVFIGDHNAAKSREILRNFGINFVINTTIEVPSYFENDPSLHYLTLGLYDNPTPGDENIFDILEPSYRYIMNIIKRNPDARILVHCHAGISRSSSIVLYYLMKSRGWDYPTALSFLKEKRPIVNPNNWYTKMLTDAHAMFMSRSRDEI